MRTAGNSHRFGRFGRDHGLPLVLYFVLALGLTWPLARDFTTLMIGVPASDPRHSVWMLWHGLQWIAGRDGFATSHLVYAPHGTSMLTDGVGPLSGIISVPFWILGPVAAYNGVILLGVWLTGYSMYVLARAVGLRTAVAFFAGVVYQITPVHLAGVWGHLEKTFIGFLPLSILVLFRALDPGRRRTWILAVCAVTLAVALQSGYQAVYAALALVFWTLATLWMAPPADRLLVFRRAALTTLCVLIGMLPLLLAIGDAAEGIHTGVSVTSPIYTPDVLQFFLPSYHHRHYALIRDHLAAWHLAPAPLESGVWQGPSLETAVTIPLTVLTLSVIALWRGPRSVRLWAAFAAIGLVLMLGPTLRVFGYTHFTALNVRIVLPYAFLDSLPGLQFMRAPGRFGMLAWIGLAMVAARGLGRLMQRWPSSATALATGATIMVLAEGWPMKWPQAALPRVPAFYRYLGRDPTTYAILDLPAAFAAKPCDGCWTDVASTYQTYQMVHRKAIAWGYFSHVDATNLVPPLRALVSGQRLSAPQLHVNGAAPDSGAAVRAELAFAQFRYVVWHKTVLRLLGKPDDDPETPRFIAEVFGPTTSPAFEDAMVRVYALPRKGSLTALTANLGSNWHPAGPSEIWATSPATVVAHVPRAMTIQLVVTPSVMHDPHGVDGMGLTGELHVGVGERTVTAPISAGVPVTIPLDLRPGSQTITLALAAGNFRPIDYGINDASLLSFSVRSIDVRDHR